MKVAFLGLGRIGRPMCEQILLGGHDVSVYDPIPSAGHGLEGRARVAATPAEAAQGAELVCLVVRDDEQCRTALGGPEGVLAGIAPGAIVAVHSTIAPATVRELHASCAAQGVRFIDAGVSWGPHRTVGAMYVMCGGDAATITEATPVFSCFAAHVVRFGDVGTGMAAKLARNLLQYELWCVVHEGLALAEAAGVDPVAFAHLYRSSGIGESEGVVLDRATSAMLDVELDPDRAAAMADSTRLGWKDIRNAIALADEVGQPTPFAHLALDGLGPAWGVALRP
jgi:3-hydroxyisobutyrate dehydrogenase-like beta-hydroxyacid dehydrogenase